MYSQEHHNKTGDKSVENEIKFFTIQDIYDERDKQIPIDLTKKYDPLHFWEDYGDKYAKEFKKIQDIQRNIGWIVHRIKTLNVETLIDVGCGFGRLEPFLIDGANIKKITAVDFSQKQLNSAKDYLKEYPQIDKVTFLKASAKRIPVENSSFDCVLSSECLMHQNYNKTNHIIREMHRITKEYVILVERFIFDGEHPYPHVWSHNYSKLVGDIGFTILEAKVIGSGVITMVLKK